MIDPEDKTLKEYLGQEYWVYHVKIGEDAISLLKSDNFAKELDSLEDIPDEIAIVFLHHPKEQDLFYVTNDEEEIQIAKREKKKERNPVGLLVKVSVQAYGTRSSVDMVGNVKKFLEDRNKIDGWSLQAGRQESQFVARLKISETDRNTAEECIKELQVKLSLLGFKANIGFKIDHASINPIYDNHTTITTGKTYKNVPSVSCDDISIKNDLEDLFVMLNRARAEELLIRKLVRIWAIIEHIFNNDFEKLLDGRVDEVMAVIDSEMQLNEDGFKKVENSLHRIPQKGRNKRIAVNMSSYVDFEQDEIYEKIKDIAKLRGKYSHGSLQSYDEDKVKPLISFSYRAILKYLEEEHDIET